LSFNTKTPTSFADITQSKAQENWQNIVRKYMRPSEAKSYWQIINSFIPYYVSWVVAYYTYQYSMILTFLIAMTSSAFLIRMFIVMHDCGHGSFFKAKKKNNFWGFIAGVATFSPYLQWSKAHKIHHKNSGNLDYRGVGDIELKTVEEYQKLTFIEKLKYRAVRSPLVFLFLGAFYIFVIQHRFTQSYNNAKENRGVHFTNLAILAFAAFITYFCGIKFYLFYQLSVLLITATLGVFLFYVQHQYENVYWRNAQDWNFFEASMKGSSFLRLPKVLQWMTGNIGYHHIHHLCSSIPNYNLEKAYKENPIFQNCTTIGIRESFRCLFLNLYDLKNEKLISFREYKRKQKQFFSQNSSQYENQL
jgi:acyl-lipid omega-6 desaturase (Delta-12 desaturase)